MRAGALVSVLCLLLAACADPAPDAPAPHPERPRARPAQVPVAPPSAQSVALKDYYAGIQSEMLSQGLLRTDGGGPDTPWDDRVLADTFLRIAFYDEYRRSATGFEHAVTPVPLRRWQKPVRVGLVFGPSADPQARALEMARVRSYLARLQRLTGHPIALVDHDANFSIFIVSEDERRAMVAAIRQAAPAMTPAELQAVENLPNETYCVATTGLDKASDTYRDAFVLIRKEQPALRSLACLHEEIAQALGLQNDSPQARPSIFNDNEEFALLTDMDEQMLRMLYDPRLKPGMTEDQARPVVQAIAAELVGGAS